MIVALDMQLAVGTSTGIGEYARGLAGGLRARGLDVRELKAPKLDPWRFDRRVLWDQVGLPIAAARSGAALLHCCSGTMPAVLPLPAVTTVHDVAWLRSQGHAKWYARAYFGRFALGQYRRAKRIVVDSEFSRSELLHFLQVPPSQVSVVYPGVAADYCALIRTPQARPYVLCAGTVERRKNLAVLIRALRRLPEEVRLVVAGPSTPYEDECRALAQREGVATRIEWRGYVTRPELLALYAGASAIAVPSTYEGFGYAAAQALCAGVPLAVSNCTSLPEVVAGDVEPLDPDDDLAWSVQLAAILSDPGGAQARAQSLRAGAIARFAWPASIAKMCEVYAAALAR
jgi:glycosyltransferase involved in cell wall biosynthesis